MATIDDVRDRLRAAVGTGELVAVKYHGGSCPGAVREIAPLQVAGDQVRARCYTSKAVKVFKLAKIELCAAPWPPTPGEATWHPAVPAPPPFDSVAEIETRYRGALEAAGWTVETRKDEYGEHLLLYGRFKNGRLRRTPSAWLSFEPMIWETVVMPDGSEERANLRPRERPWVVYGHGERGSSWKRCDRALAAFITAAGLAGSEPETARQ